MTLGTEVRLSRLFTDDKSVIIAMDHGMFDGPIEGMERVDQTAGNICDDVDGILLSPGIFSRVAGTRFSSRFSPAPIVRINWSTIYCFQWEYTSGCTVCAYTPQEAGKLGCDTVLISLSLRTGSEERDAKNVEVFRKLCGQSHDLGLAVIGEYFPVNVPALSAPELDKEVRIGVRILAELGADVIKTYHTENFIDTVKGCPVPILTLGGSRCSSQLEALRVAQRQISDGASGVVFGRNAIQVPDPVAFQKALIQVVRKGIDAETACANFNISNEEVTNG